MINRQALLADLQKFLQRIEADLLERSESTEVPEVPAALHAEYERAAKAERTAQNYEDWRTDTITQAAAAWVLSCVFVRFLEDNSLIDPPKIAGPGERLARARDEHELYFRSHPQHTDREYLLSIFGELAKLPGTKDIFGEHNAINDLPYWLSGDAAGELLNFFQKIDASTGELIHDFTDPNWDTRFLGDLYQDLSKAARDKFALLQTPDFVEEFILDRTLDPAIDEFGLVSKTGGTDPQSSVLFKMIDPACGSGHFLLGAFPRLLARWQRKEPVTNIRELTQRSLDSIHGVDINPFAVAIAKFRLLLVAMGACDIRRLAAAPAFQINVACGDSLLHGANRTSTGQNLWDYAEGAADEELYSHAYPGENLSAVRNFLMLGNYHCVVANPPYSVPTDKKINVAYRRRFNNCHLKYSLTVPFMELIFKLSQEGGFTGQITATSFMKRSFGKKIVENFIPTIELSHVIDLRGVVFGNAGFGGTSTAILFGKNRRPITSVVRTVMALKGEPGIPTKPAQGVVWNAILRQIDVPDSESDFISVRDFDRTRYSRHPWSIGGGGASDVRELIEESLHHTLGEFGDVGIGVVTLEDDAFEIERDTAARTLIPSENLRGFVIGDKVRDWTIAGASLAIFPHDSASFAPIEVDSIMARLWPLRTLLAQRLWFRKTMLDRNMPWFAYGHISIDKFRTPLSITLSFLSTHSNFVLERNQKILNRSAPMVKLKASATESDYLNALGYLSSSVVCFLLKQVCHSHGAGGGTRVKAGKSPLGDDNWESHYEFDSTNLKKLVFPSGFSSEYPGQLEQAALRVQPLREALSAYFGSPSSTSLRTFLDRVRIEAMENQQLMVGLQEELDWQVYGAVGLLSHPPLCDSPPPVALGQRAFEIALARKIIRGETRSNWFERHGSSPTTEVPCDAPSYYQDILRQRIEIIENDPNIRLLEQPEYKRRWNNEPWESQLVGALREWLLLRLETFFDFDGRMIEASEPSKRMAPLGDISMYSVTQLADAALRDPQFMEVGELYRDDPAFDVQALVEELVLAESVPHLPILRYKDSGLRKRAEWEKTWDLQRREDAGESVGTIPVPPKYTSADFISTGGARYWSLRGKLDVPKERWISFPHCEGPDGTLVICWAGYDHLQQAQAISAYYVRVQTEFGGSDDPRLIPLLASLIELLPWLKQWHNEPNANFDGLRMGDYFEGFVNEEARNLGKTLAEIKAWVPPKKVAKKKAASKSATKKKTTRKASKSGLELEG